MLIKAVLIFLLGMALLAMIGRAITRKGAAKPARLGVAKTLRCPQCGRLDVAGAVLGRKPCECGAK
jgi:hypothetical protein